MPDHINNICNNPPTEKQKEYNFHVDAFFKHFQLMLSHRGHAQKGCQDELKGVIGALKHGQCAMRIKKKYQPDIKENTIFLSGYNHFLLKHTRLGDKSQVAKLSKVASEAVPSIKNNKLHLSM